MSEHGSILARLAASTIRLYQLVVSPSLGRNCRFSPSCSAYAIGAINTHGFLRGSALAARRLGRCQPLVEGGYDPVPERI
jgi:uncharacterized protein